MSDKQEQLRVLRQVQDGSLTPEEAILRFAGPDEGQQDAEGARWFVVRITDLDTGKEKIVVRLPIDLVSVGARLGARYVPNGARFDLDHVLEQAKEGYRGAVFEASDDSEREYVQIHIE